MRLDRLALAGLEQGRQTRCKLLCDWNFRGLVPHGSDSINWLYVRIDGRSAAHTIQIIR